MNSIKNVPARVLNRRPGHSLEAERAPAPGPEAARGAGVAGTEMPPGTETQLRGPGGPGTGQVFRD